MGRLWWAMEWGRKPGGIKSYNSSRSDGRCGGQRGFPQTIKGASGGGPVRPSDRGSGAGFWGGRAPRAMHESLDESARYFGQGGNDTVRRDGNL